MIAGLDQEFRPPAVEQVRPHRTNSASGLEKSCRLALLMQASRLQDFVLHSSSVRLGRSKCCFELRLSQESSSHFRQGSQRTLEQASWLQSSRSLLEAVEARASSLSEKIYNFSLLQLQLVAFAFEKEEKSPGPLHEQPKRPNQGLSLAADLRFQSAKG